MKYPLDIYHHVGCWRHEKEDWALTVAEESPEVNSCWDAQSWGPIPAWRLREGLAEGVMPKQSLEIDIDVN